MSLNPDDAVSEESTFTTWHRLKRMTSVGSATRSRQRAAAQQPPAAWLTQRYLGMQIPNLGTGVCEALGKGHHGVLRG